MLKNITMGFQQKRARSTISEERIILIESQNKIIPNIENVISAVKNEEDEEYSQESCSDYDENF